jgi:hypothetical protein
MPNKNGTMSSFVLQPLVKIQSSRTFDNANQTSKIFLKHLLITTKNKLHTKPSSNQQTHIQRLQKSSSLTTQNSENHTFIEAQCDPWIEPLKSS